MDRSGSEAELATYADFDNRYLRHDRTTLTTLATVDLAPFAPDGDVATRTGAAREIRKACIDIGFFHAKGHGFAQTEIDALLEYGRRFFALPLEEKLKLRFEGGKGYIPPGGLTPGARAPDLKERYYFSREFALDPSEHAKYPPAEQFWPEERVLPGFRPFVTRHIERCVALIQRAGHALAESLDLDPQYFERENGRFGATLVFNYYPPLDPATLQSTQWSFSPHTDYGSFTFVFQDSLGGLQVRNAAGQWIDVVPTPGALVFNVGDLVALATNDLYTSNLHRVANFSPRERVSVTVFVGPPSTAEIACLPTCQGPDNPARYPTVNADAYTKALLDEYHRTGRPGMAAQTLARFQRKA